MSDVFYAARHRLEQNRRDAAGLNVKHAIQDTTGGTEVGLAICVLGRAVLVISPDDGYRLAKGIADKLTELKTNPQT